MKKTLTYRDLSYNQSIGDLPSSFATLRGLSRMFLQHNEFTGLVIFLADLQLSDLNIQDNHFNGIIPKQFQTIHNLWFGGNMFDEGDNSPPWNFPLENPLEQQNNTTPPSTESGAVKSYPLTEHVRHKKEKSGHVAIYYGVGALMAACLAIFIMIAKD